MAVQVELDPDGDFRPDQGAYPLQEIALAIIITDRRHRAVQVEQDRIQRQARADLLKDFVAERFVDRLQRPPAGLRLRRQPLYELMARCLGEAAPKCQRGKYAVRVDPRRIAMMPISS